MNWFNDERQRYIAELLYVVGHLKRAYLMRKYRISVAQASHDLRTFMRRHPKAMIYDKKLKAYIATRKDARGNLIYDWDGMLERAIKEVGIILGKKK